MAPSNRAEQKRAQAHHLVAQSYLARWADSGRVSVRLRDGKEFATGTPVIGQETDFYAIELADGSMDASAEEGFLRSIDGQAATVLRRLLTTRRLEPVDRLLLARCIAVQWMRGRRSREMTQALWASLATAFEDLGLAPPDEPAKADGRPETPKNFHIGLVLERFSEATPMLATRDWFVAEFRAPCLLTSDEPITLHRNPDPANGMIGLGLGNADEIYYPLSPSHCLVMTNNTGLGFHWLPNADELAEWINRYTVAGAWDQLYRHPCGPPFPETPPRPEGGVVVNSGGRPERRWPGRAPIGER